MLPKARENAGHPVVSFAPNWLRGWCGFSEPIIERERGTYEVLDSFRHPIEYFSNGKPLKNSSVFHTHKGKRNPLNYN